MTNFLETFSNALDPESFKENGYRFIDILSDYLKAVQSGNMPVASSTDPIALLKEWELPSEISASCDVNKTFALISKYLEQTTHVHHPGCISNQIGTPLPLAVFCDMMCSLLNNSVATFAYAPVSVVMEKHIINWMANRIGYDNNAGGFFTSGGSLANLTGLLAARQNKAGYDVWKEGVHNQNLAIMVTEDSHYSTYRSAQIMGIGKDGVIVIPTDKDFRATKEAMESAYMKAGNRKVFAIAASSCNTGPGVHDDINLFAEFASRKNIWLHIDAAHGGPVVLSDKYKYLMHGVEKADSIAWDLHKMMMMPQLGTAVIYKDNKTCYSGLEVDAPYLYKKFSNATEENEEDVVKDDILNWGKKTIECTKFSIVTKIYICLQYYGEKFFADYVTHSYDMARKFASMIQGRKDFELALEPQSNIVCFRYIKDGLSNEDLNSLQTKIRQNLMNEGEFLITEAPLKGIQYLRTCIMNPLTTEKTLTLLLNNIESIVEKVSL